MKAVILTCNIGGGHNSAAKALCRELESRGIPCDIADALSFGPPCFSKAVSGLHAFGYRHFPRVYGMGYRQKEKHRPHGGDCIEYRINTVCVPRLYRFLCTGGYDIVLAPHVFPAQMLTCIRRRHPDAPWRSWFIATDYTCSPGVGEIDPDGWIIPDARLCGEFIACGAPAERLHPLGIPTAAAFGRSVAPAEARARLNLPAKGRIVLVMSGSIGCGPIRSLVLQMARCLPRDTSVVVLCGNNKKQLSELKRIARQNRNIIPMGFTDQIPLYLRAVDAVITKPGGLSSTEIARCGVPTVFLLSVPGCESRNFTFFTENGMALGAKTVRSAIRQMLHLLSHSDTCRRIVTAQQSLPGGAAGAICDLITAFPSV